MSSLLDVYYPFPADGTRERRIADIARMHGGEILRRQTTSDGRNAKVWLIIEFDQHDSATLAQKAILTRGEWAEPPLTSETNQNSEWRYSAVVNKGNKS